MSFPKEHFFDPKYNKDCGRVCLFNENKLVLVANLFESNNSKTGMVLVDSNAILETNTVLVEADSLPVLGITPFCDANDLSIYVAVHGNELHGGFATAIMPGTNVCKWIFAFEIGLEGHIKSKPD